MYQTINLPNGGTVEVWVSPPPAPTHKTVGLTKTEYRKLFTTGESIKIDRLRGKIESTSVAGFPNLDDDAAPLGLGGVTYRDILRLCFNAFADANDVDMTHPDTILAINALEAVGVFNTSRKNEILLGLEL